MFRKGKNLPKGKKLVAKGLKRIDTEKAFGKAVVGGTEPQPQTIPQPLGRPPTEKPVEPG